MEKRHKEQKPSNRWMTYRQAQAQGWQLRAGEKGTQIQHWIWEEARTRLGKDGNPERDNEGKPIKELVCLSRPKVSLILGSELGLGYDPGQHAGYVDHWVQILTDTPKEILYAAADAEKISELGRHSPFTLALFAGDFSALRTASSYPEFSNFEIRFHQKSENEQNS